MKISTKGRYGLRAVLDISLHQSEGPVTISSIAGRQELSERYLEQLLITLKQNGIINSIRGFQGGYILAKEPRLIKVGDIVRALEGPLAPVDCVNEDKLGECSRTEACVTKIVWEDLRDSITKVLDSYTVEDLMLEHQKMKANSFDNYSI